MGVSEVLNDPSMAEFVQCESEARRRRFDAMRLSGVAPASRCSGFGTVLDESAARPLKRHRTV